MRSISTRPSNVRTLCVAVVHLVSTMPHIESFVAHNMYSSRLLGSREFRSDTLRDKGVTSLHYSYGNNDKKKKRGTSSSSTSSNQANVGYPEGKPATYELQKGKFGSFGPESIVYPLLKQTQLQDRGLKVVYDARRDGWDARSFHRKVDGRGASVRTRQGTRKVDRGVQSSRGGVPRG